MLTYIRDKRELFHLLVYREKFLDANQPVQRRIIQGYFDIAPEPHFPYEEEEREYFLQHLYMGGTTVILRWVQNGCDLLPKQVAQMIGWMVSA